jgi:hypothetical protein
MFDRYWGPKVYPNLTALEAALTGKGDPNPIAEHGDMYTLEEFIEDCKGGSFYDYDGSGYYASPTHHYWRFPANPSDIMRGRIDRRWTHVAWFNK